MKATLSVEYIGSAIDDATKKSSFIADVALGPGAGRYIFGGPRMRPWVARLTGLSTQFGFERQFLKPKYDYSQSSGNGNRGVRLWYVLESGFIYQVRGRSSWSKPRDRFCEVDVSGEIRTLSRDAAAARLT